MIAAIVLAEGLAALGLDVEATARERLLDFQRLLEKWNRTHNLTAIRDSERMITHHLLDSLAVLPQFPVKPGLRVIDVGSGGGLPGLPLAIVRPDWQVVLLDSNRKKGVFLRQAIIELKLKNAEAVTARAEDFTPATPFDVAISRAFSDLATFAAAARRLLAPGGRLFAMKGIYPREELAHLPDGIRLVGAPVLRVPGLDAERHLVILAETPA